MSPSATIWLWATFEINRASKFWTAALAFSVVVAIVPSLVNADCDDPFADPLEVLDFHLRISAADWDSLRDDDQVGNGCDAQYAYFDVEFRCGESEPWISIGARRKRGDQRGKDTNEKPPIKLDFNRTVPGQRWPSARGDRGFRKLSLNNGQEDNPGGILTALLSEHYSWELMRSEVPTASGVAYARLNVYLGDATSLQYHGIYILIEDIDRTAIRTRFGDGEGILLKTTSGGCRNREVFNDGPNAASDATAAWLQQDPNDFPGTWTDETNQVIELEPLLRAEAVRDVLANGADTALGGNYSNYLSFDPAVAGGKRHYLPWDLDDVFRPFPQNVPFTFSLENSCSVVGDQTRCANEIEDRYLEIVCQLTNGTLHEERLLADFASRDALLRPIIADEVERVWPDDDPFDEQTEGTYANEYERMREWIGERIPEVRRQVTAAGFVCDEGCGGAAPESCTRLHCEGERLCENDRWTTCQVSPDLEEPGNGLDDDCDFQIDEGELPTDSDGGPGGPTPKKPGNGGCGCSAGQPAPTGLGFALALCLLGGWRRRDATGKTRPQPSR